MYLFARNSSLKILFKENIQINIVRNCGSKEKDIGGKIIKLPPEPTNCCMAGCPNCVWVEYAQQLSQLFHDQDDKINKLILDKITDPNMKAFLEMELRTIKKYKQSLEKQKDKD